MLRGAASDAVIPFEGLWAGSRTLRPGVGPQGPAGRFAREGAAVGPQAGARCGFPAPGAAPDLSFHPQPFTTGRRGSRASAPVCAPRAHPANPAKYGFFAAIVPQKPVVISPRTAQKHISNILTKMQASCRTEAGVRAVREGLLE